MRLRRGESVRLEARRHGVVLARPFAESGLLAAAGAVLVFAGWPFSVAGALGVALAAAGALGAVWRWERTRIVVTDERLVILEGTLRRREASVSLASVGAVEVEQSLLGRVLGYGTVVAADLEIPYVPRPESLVARG
jgi:uncharacterized membrane protein YdbT with pleckstrin-like domain